MFIKSGATESNIKNGSTRNVFKALVNSIGKYQRKAKMVCSLTTAKGPYDSHEFPIQVLDEKLFLECVMKSAKLYPYRMYLNFKYIMHDDESLAIVIIVPHRVLVY